MSYPKLQVSLHKLRHNAQVISKTCASQGISVWGVTKVLCGEPRVGRAMLSGGVKYLADSRILNLQKLKQAGFDKLVLLRIPMLSEVAAVVDLVELCLVSEQATIVALNNAAKAAKKVQKVVLMIDLGDLREGIYYQDALDYYKTMADMPTDLSHVNIVGIGTNLTCYGAVIPTPQIVNKLLKLKNEMEQELGWELNLVSGGNSSSLSLLWKQVMPQGVNNLRIGEGIILGKETAHRQPVPDAFQDVCLVQAEIVELQRKPSLPEGETGEDAFGNKPQFEDQGVHYRAIVAIGRQDADPEGLRPVDENVKILGASSDHLIIALPENHNYAVSNIVEFIPSYSALLRLSTSPYVEKEYLE